MVLERIPRPANVCVLSPPAKGMDSRMGRQTGAAKPWSAANRSTLTICILACPGLAEASTFPRG
jgi:hypothetical protein